MSREQGGPARPVAAYVYDGDGNRLQQIDYSGVQPITTTYTNDNLGLSQVLIADNGSSQTANLYGLDLISQDDGAQTRTLLADGLGSVRQELANDAIQTVTTYEPYGNILAQTGNSGTTYAFTGEQFDDSTGLLYLRARYYNPGLKLFISRDPFPGWLGLPASQHGYTYAQNNPVNLTDPTGNCPWCLVAAGAFYVGEVSRQTYNNMQEGMPFFEAIYYKNQDQAEILKAIKSGLLLPLEAIPGLDGAADSFLDQLIDNIADPCAGIFDSTLEATARGAAVDLTFLGLGKSVNTATNLLSPGLRKLGDALPDYAASGHSPEMVKSILRGFDALENSDSIIIGFFRRAPGASDFDGALRTKIPGDAVIWKYDDGRRFIWREAREEFAFVTSDLDIAFIVDVSGAKPALILSDPKANNIRELWKVFGDSVNLSHPSPLINHGDNFSGQLAGIAPAFKSGGRREMVYLYGKNGYIGNGPYDVFISHFNQIFGQ